MKINEVLRKENIGKLYKFKGVIYKVVENSNSVLELIDSEDDYATIEEGVYLIDIINGEFEEYLDWTKVPVDAKVLVSNDGKDWIKRHFAKYEDEHVYTFRNGLSSFTTEKDDVYRWNYAKLYEEE